MSKLVSDYADMFNVSRKVGESDKAFQFRVAAALREQGKSSEAEEVERGRPKSLRELVFGSQ